MKQPNPLNQKNLVMFCQKAVVFAALICFIIIWGSLVIVAQSDTLSDLIKNGFRKGLLMTGQAEGFLRAIMLVIMAVLVLLLLCAAFKHFDRADKRRLYIDIAVMSAVMLAIYVFLLTQLRIIPTNDARSITDQALALAQSGANSLDADSVYANYFSKYSNNYPIILFLAGFFKVMQAVGITDIWLPLYILNMTGLLLGTLFTFLTAKRVMGLGAAAKVLLIATLNPVYYLMMFWVYTATLSVPFVTGMIYLAVCIRDVTICNSPMTSGKIADDNTVCIRDVIMCKSSEAVAGRSTEEGITGTAATENVGMESDMCAGKFDMSFRSIHWVKLVILSVLAGLVCSIGFLLRATNAIVVIAIAICVLIGIVRRLVCRLENPLPDSGKQEEADGISDRKIKDISIRQTIVRWVAACLIAALVAGVTYVGINLYCSDFFESVSDGNYPITHWLMMGSHGDGMYNTEDDKFTFSLETSEEKKEATWSQTVENYKEAGVAGTIKLIVKKMIINWSDGYFAMDLRLEQSTKYSPIYSYIAGNHNDAFHLYCQGFWLAIGVLVIVAAVRLLRGMLKQMPHGQSALMQGGQSVSMQGGWSTHGSRSESGSVGQTMPMLPFLLVLILFGAIVFYWFWEVKPAYALPFLYVFYLLAVCGQESGLPKEDLKFGRLRDKEQCTALNPEDGEQGLGGCMEASKESVNLSIDMERKRRESSEFVKMQRRLLSWVIAFLLGLECIYNYICTSAGSYYDYSIRCTQKSWLKQIAMEDGDTVTQEFYPGAAFNRITLSVIAKKSSSDSSSGGTAACLHVTIQDTDGNVVYTGMITREDINDDSKVTLDVGEIPANSEDGYLLTITKEDGSFGDLALRTRKGICLDGYKGELRIKEELQGTDLYMQVYMYYL